MYKYVFWNISQAPPDPATLNVLCNEIYDAGVPLPATSVIICVRKCLEYVSILYLHKTNLSL